MKQFFLLNLFILFSYYLFANDKPIGVVLTNSNAPYVSQNNDFEYYGFTIDFIKGLFPDNKLISFYKDTSDLPIENQLIALKITRINWFFDKRSS